jgi:glutamate synthase (NADPH) small chain
MLSIHSPRSIVQTKSISSRRSCLLVSIRFPSKGYVRLRPTLPARSHYGLTTYYVPPADIDRKAKFQIDPVKVRKQDPAERVQNWNEVTQVFTVEEAVIEAQRCIQCPAAPCIKACPVHNDIPGAFALLEDGDVIGAANKFRETSALPEMCGRLCPQESLCEGACVVRKKKGPVAIGKLEFFAADYQRKNFGLPLPEMLPPTGRKIAVVGAGPAGIEVAQTLASKGHGVVIYDNWPEPGGILRYGIPNFKMEKHILDDKIDQLRQMGVQFRQNVTVGVDITVDQLFGQGFDVVFLGQGAPTGSKLGIGGEDLPGIYEATDFLVRGNRPPEEWSAQMTEPVEPGPRVVVIGGGDTSMDCVRTARRLGAEEVVCVYRRTEAEMKGREEERVHARQENVKFQFLTIPLRFIAGADGRVAGVECARMELGEPDESGRRRPIQVPNSEFVIEAMTIVIAIGYRSEPFVAQATPGLRTDRDGLIITERRTGQTSRGHVFAGGDNVNGADLVVTALADARRAALAIHDFLSG